MADLIERLTRPIIGIENRTAQEAFDIMSDRIRSALALAEGQATEGMVLVPREPLPEMIGAWYRVKNGHHFHDEPAPTDTSDYAAYRAMLAAAPSPAVQP